MKETERNYFNKYLRGLKDYLDNTEDVTIKDYSEIQGEIKEVREFMNMDQFEKVKHVQKKLYVSSLDGKQFQNGNRKVKKRGINIKISG